MDEETDTTTLLPTTTNATYTSGSIQTSRAGSTTQSPIPPVNTTNTTKPDSGWLGLDSTQILIIFLVIVFAVLIIFLLIYYYVIKRMRSNPDNRLTQKSASGSIGEERARNIFAHPERQLAVDQSTRMNPNSPASQVSEADQHLQQNSPNVGQAIQQQHQQQQQQKQLPASQQPQPQQPAAAALTSSPANQPQPQSQQQQQQQPQPTAKASQQSEPPASAGGRKSGSLGKGRDRVKAGGNHHSVLGALAGLRDTLRESTEGHK